MNRIPRIPGEYKREGISGSVYVPDTTKPADAVPLSATVILLSPLPHPHGDFFQCFSPDHVSLPGICAAVREANNLPSDSHPASPRRPRHRYRGAGCEAAMASPRSPDAADARPETVSSPPCRLPPEDVRVKLCDGLLAVLIALVAQLLMTGVQYGLNKGGVDFPASILAMAGVFVVFSLAGCIVPGVEQFYRRRLKRAVSTATTYCQLKSELPWKVSARG